MAKNDRMGSGLDLLFEDNFGEESSEKAVSTLRVSMIEPDRSQPRRTFDEDALNELAENIKIHGVLQPILVRPIGEDTYRIVAGERRWRAARIAGLTEIPAVVRDLTDAQAAQISLIENIQRCDLDPIDEAAALKRLIDDFGMTQEEVSKTVGRSRSAVANSIRLLNLPVDIAAELKAGNISVGHAKLILGFDDPTDQLLLAEYAKQGCSVRELEKAAEKLRNKPVEGEELIKQTAEEIPAAKFADPFKKYSIETEESFKQSFGIRAKVRKEKSGYSLKLDFKTEEDLKELIEQLTASLS
ncbi:chromosome partitioning protein, ParB family [Ruminococcus sp. YE71]|uniref:ParB/RepB/Spo0J family partition protein n=1 Tax=unclassified Ruminococcus TaxID=2608920 RepID=UPI000887E2E1|nr:MULTISPECIES: ParB/RepB/Spo0J family partition protein [unclassified Ruminococcus]SDA20305.1 chromosome partitioning protein, ParB family [Ruminococcus sp. YE78]SFW32228.1 chromosome partitioning protein, ParB family [Ruminococcus sp. YE71]